MKSTLVRLLFSLTLVTLCSAMPQGGHEFAQGPGPVPICYPGTPQCPNGAINK